jgi:hypothetical protein
MPAAALLFPVALLAAGALLAWAAGRARLGAGRALAALSAWAALGALVLIWAPQRSPLDLNGGELGAGIRLVFQLDAVAFAFCLFVLVPVAVLLTFRPPPSPPLALLATAASLLSLLAAGLILAVLAWGVTLLVVMLLVEGGGAAQPGATRFRQQAAWLLLIWAAAALWARGGTDQYAAIPVSALTAPIFGLVAIGALVASGLLPWKPWPALLWERLPPELAGISIVSLYFFGFYLLVRMYDSGDGRLPSVFFNLALASLGAACALGAALRAQAAATRRAYLAEVLPMTGGFALLALALGTALGVAAALATLAAAALLVALLPLVEDEALSAPLILTLAVAAGLPPTAVFGTRLLDLQASLESNEAGGYLALVGAAAWLIGLAAAARAVRLPPRREAPGASPVGAVLVAGLLVAGGAALGVLQAAIAIPAAATVIPFPGTALTGTPSATAAASGSWPAVALGGLAVVAVIALAIAGRRQAVPALAGPEPAPLLAPRWELLPDRLGAVADRLEIPAEFRVTGWKRLDQAMARSSVWLWIALFVLLALLVGR